MLGKYSIFSRVLLFFVVGFSTTYSRAASFAWEEKYADESSLELLMERTVELHKDWSSQETIHFITKVQKEDAKDLGEIPIDYDKGFQVVKNIRASVTTPEGKKLQYKFIQDLKPYSGVPMYSNRRTKVITLPAVTPGCTIEWQVTIVDKKPIIRDSFYDYFSFTNDIPIKSLRYTLIIPKEMPVRIAHYNTQIKPQVREEPGKVIYQWQLENTDKFEPEEYMPPGNEFNEYVSISSIKDWKNIAEWYWGLVTKNLKISQAIRDEVKKITAAKVTDKEKAQAVIEFVRENFRYVSMSFGYNRYEPHPSDEVFTNKYGDCKDQVLAAMAMLKEAGIRSYLALYCDEEDGNPEDKLPKPNYFDHVILALRLGDKIHYTDVLRKGYRVEETPLGIQGGYVFVINENGGAFSQLPVSDDKENYSSQEKKIQIREDGSAMVETVSEWPKDFSIETREQFKRMTEKEKTDFFEALDAEYNVSGKVIERKWEGIESDYGSVKSFLKYESSQWADVSGDFVSFGEGHYGRGLDFTKKERKYPIVFWSNSLQKTTNTYSLPDSFEIVNIPKDVSLKSKFSEFSRTYQRRENNIIETEITIFKRARLPASDYEEVKDFYNKVYQLTNGKIIIKKRR
jgi:transglutaminase-like putative cysteine protease